MMSHGQAIKTLAKVCVPASACLLPRTRKEPETYLTGTSTSNLSGSLTSGLPTPGTTSSLCPSIIRIHLLLSRYWLTSGYFASHTRVRSSELSTRDDASTSDCKNTPNTPFTNAFASAADRAVVKNDARTRGQLFLVVHYTTAALASFVWVARMLDDWSNAFLSRNIPIGFCCASSSQATP